MDFVVEKIEKAMKNLERALNNIENGELRIAIADLQHARENSEESIYLILAELENKKYKVKG
jgi:glutathionyl-hydroquinone reductase